MRARLLFLGLLLGLIALLPATVHAAVPGAGTVSQATPTSSWTGGPFLSSNPSGLCLTAVDPSCDTYALTITPPATGNYTVEITTTPSSEGDDYDLYVSGPSGATVGSSTTSGGHEKVVLTNPSAGTYSVNTLAWLVTPGGTYQGKATLAVASTPPPGDPTSVLYPYDPSAAQATVEVPLRVVAVGFAPGELDEAKILGQIPDYQRPGVLIPRGQDSHGDESPLFGNETLVNHGRSYYNNSKPFTVPYEYRWKTRFVYAPANFTQGLFTAMRANSTTGDFSKSANRQYLEGYNATRGVYRGTGAVVQAEHPGSVHRRREDRGLDLGQLQGDARLGRSGARQGPGRNPGYTVYILNTWDSAEARAILKPQNEYHVWKINRTDPDTGQFDGIDWARIWGGRYRFMMVDAGAAPNPYEAESWGNRNRTVYGSANYEPPLWEYRANAPRPVTLVNIDEGVEQALTPGATWMRTS